MNLSDINTHLSSIGETISTNKNTIIDGIKKSVKNTIIPILEDWITEKEEDTEELERKRIDDFIEKNYQELKEKQESKKEIKNVKVKDKNTYNIWKMICNRNLKFMNQSIYTNISFDDSGTFNKYFMEFLSFYGLKIDKNRKKTLITSASNIGKYSINFTDVDLKKNFNYILLTQLLNGSSYYPQSYILRNKEDYHNLFLNTKQKYFVKGLKKNTGISFGKNVVFRKEVLENFPLIFQENINHLRLNNGYKEDEILYVLFVKNIEKIRTFIHTKTMIQTAKEKYNDKINLNNHFTFLKNCKNPAEMDKLVPLVRFVSQKLMNNISKKLLKDHEVEFWLTGWNIIFAANNHPWLLGINPTPNQCENNEARKVHYPIYQQILEMIFSHENKKEYILKDFIEI